MYKTITTLQNFFKPYYIYIITAVILIIFIIVAYYGYKRTVKTQIEDKKFKDVANANTRKVEANVYFFHVDWCPHCVKAKPQWEEFVQAYDGRNINNFIVRTHSIDCTGDVDREIEHIIQTYKITSYPTVKLIIDGEKAIELDSKITKDTLTMFVTEVLDSK
tara:strand:+ start:68 stop:553 length:486 start_codon:yes stop_codon:yes gene_type:complete